MTRSGVTAREEEEDDDDDDEERVWWHFNLNESECPISHHNDSEPR